MPSAIEFPSKNLIIGGNFDTNPWQRNTTLAGVAANAYVADRFAQVFLGAGGGQFTIRRTANAPTVAQAGIFTTNCHEALVTTADAAIAAGDGYFIGQAIEGYNFAQIAQRAFTLSFWVRANPAGIYCVSFRNAGADRSYVAEYTINAINTWEYKTVSITASPAAGTWDYINGIGIQVDFAQAMGATFQTGAPNTWAVGNFLATANQVNGLSAINNYLMISLISVKAGTQFSSFDVRTFQEEVNLCKRYYQKSFPLTTAPAANVAGGILFGAQNAGALANRSYYGFSIPMRDTPTMATFNPGAAGVEVRDFQGGGADCTATATVATSAGFNVACVGAAGTAQGNPLSVAFTASSEL